MAPGQARRVLMIITALTILWTVFLLIQRPLLQDEGVTSLDWSNVVGFPLLIVTVLMVARYVRWRNDPASRPLRAGPGEAVATGIVWGIVKAIQERYTFGTTTMAPLISAAVVFLAVLAGNWIVARMSRRR